MPESRLNTVKGFYELSLNKKLAAKFKKKATFIYVDCDLYKSTVPVLKFIKSFFAKKELLLLLMIGIAFGEIKKRAKKGMVGILSKNKNLVF